MSEARAAIRYAKAVLDLAIDGKVPDEVESDMRDIVSTISTSKELQMMLGSPVLKGADKKAALKVIFKGKHAITEGLLNILVDNKRIPMLEEVAKKYITLNEQLKGEGVAYVTTAVPITDDLEKDILERVTKLTGNKVVVENKVDENLIGGFVLRVGDLQYDASIANKLSNIKREFESSL
ncbi:MAG: ATP synthase F1 subunit delta [Eudoraea sp.]|nr:ATP synthase F1 subunit delta [Eudoraea sp.]